MYARPAELPASLPLESLVEVPWADLTHAYGSAEDVPALIEALAAGGEEGERASKELYGNVYHQGTRWKASPFTIPFFVGLLERAELRVALLERLLAMAIGFEESFFPEGFDLEWAQSEQQEVDLSNEDEYGIDMVNTHDAVARAFPVFAALLDDSDPVVRSEAAHLLAYLPAAGATSIVELQRRLESCGESRPSFLLALGMLGRQLSIACQIGAEPSLSDPVETRVGWACAASLLGDPTQVDELMGLITKDLPAIGSWLDGSTTTLVVESAAVHSGWLTENRMRVIAAHLDNDGPFKACWVTDVLLRTILRERPLPNKPQDLTPLARLVLESLQGATSWNSGSHLNGNWSGLLDSYLVPSEQEALASYLAGMPLTECLDKETLKHYRSAVKRTATRST